MSADGRLTIHAWGFFDGENRTLDGVAVSAESPFDAFQRIKANIVHHGGSMFIASIHRTLDGWFVGADWETPATDTAMRMWHRVCRESDGWPAPSPVAADQTGGER